MSIRFIDLKAQYQALKLSIDARINTVLEHGQYIMGPEVYELEQKLAHYVGVTSCVATSSGTDSLLIAMMALGIGQNDEIITTPFTFVATGEMIALVGATPVFVDIDPVTYNIDPAKIEAAITSRTKAIMPVSIYGQCADYDKINSIAAKYGLSVIEDGAQSFGSTYKGKKSCSLTTVGGTSFFPSKPLGCYGDGGALFTDDKDLAQQMRDIRVHGQDRRYHHPRVGINGRLDTMQAAIILAKLERFDWEVNKREQLGERYTGLINQYCPEIVTPVISEDSTSVYAQYTIQVENRESVVQKLSKLGIPTAVHYPVPLHLQPAFSELAVQSGQLSVSESMAKHVLSLPMSPDLNEEDQDEIVQKLKLSIQ